MLIGQSTPVLGCGCPAPRFSSSFFTATAQWALEDVATPTATLSGQYFTKDRLTLSKYQSNGYPLPNKNPKKTDKPNKLDLISI